MFKRREFWRWWNPDSGRYRAAKDPAAYHAPNHPREVARRKRQIARGVPQPSR